MILYRCEVLSRSNLQFGNDDKEIPSSAEVSNNAQGLCNCDTLVSSGYQVSLSYLFHVPQSVE